MTTTVYDFKNALEWSPFVERLTQRFPDLQDASSYSQKWSDGALYHHVYDDVFNSDSDQQLYSRLRKQRNWMMGRIGLRDLMGLADLEETIAATSELADALVASSLDWHYKKLCQRYGTPIGAESGKPQKMIVIGMGKLGGQELNYSSDIDLIFAYAEGGSTEGANKSIGNDQFFLRLGQALNKSLVDMTEDGFVYRVDMRLRPFGDAGPLASSFNALEHYYEIHGRAWERYALVKARVIAGDFDSGQALFDILRPFVYRRYVDFTAMQSLRDLKSMIAEQVVKKGMEENLKLGSGGIREIEFIAQAFQLVQGGRTSELQSRSLMPTLKTLCKLEFFDEIIFNRLMEAYRFLRIAENRLQMWNDQQTHSLPTNESQQLALAESMGYDNYDVFYTVLKNHREFVEQQFRAVFNQDETLEKRSELSAVWQSDLTTDDAKNNSQLNDDALKLVSDFKASRIVQTLSKEGLERLDETMPLILEALIHSQSSTDTVRRVMSVIESIAKRSVYLVLLKENPDSLNHLIRLCEASAWMADMLVKYPALLDQLLDERELYTPLVAEDLKSEAIRLLESANMDEELFMDQLRQWRHAQVFRVAAADVVGHLPVMKVSDYLTWIAEAVLHVSIEFAWRLQQQKNGLPGGLEQDILRNPFMILGYGKLGGIELGFGSDLDVVFVYEGVPSGAQAVKQDGRSIDNAVYFIRLGQKVISILSTIMPSGRLYEVDSRLRPNGKSGMLVTDLESYKAYIKNKAWVWEHQALVRARAVAGDEQSIKAFEGFRAEFLSRQRDVEHIKNEVVDMRKKMREALDRSSENGFDLKQGVGGIVDIEFMMQFMVLAYSSKYPDLIVYTDNVRILEAVGASGLLSRLQVEQLTEAYQVYRSKYHRLALANESGVINADCYLENRQVVEKVWQSIFG